MEYVTNYVMSCFVPSIKTIIFLVLCVVIIYYVWNSVDSYRNKSHKESIEFNCRSIRKDETVFVSMVAIDSNDTRAVVVKTLCDLFEKAYCPYRVFVGIILYENTSEKLFQNDIDSINLINMYRKQCQDNSCLDMSRNIRILKQDSNDYRGLYPARAIVETKLFRNEKFYMLINNSVLFTPKWEKNLINEWVNCKQKTFSKNPLLTSLPLGFQQHNYFMNPPDFGHAPGTYLRFKDFETSTPNLNFIQTESVEFQRKFGVNVEPMLGLFWTSTFSFSLSTIVRDVPYDPSIEFISNDTLMALRLWTHGYDFFHPVISYLYNNYDYNYNVSRPNDETKHRIEQIFNNNNGQQILMGLGKVRTIEQYQGFIGIDLRTKTFTSLSGIMGVQSDASSVEILTRFGTWKNFDRLKTILLKTMYNK